MESLDFGESPTPLSSPEGSPAAEGLRTVLTSGDVVNLDVFANVSLGRRSFEARFPICRQPTRAIVRTRDPRVFTPYFIPSDHPPDGQEVPLDPLQRWDVILTIGGEYMQAEIQASRVSRVTKAFVKTPLTVENTDWRPRIHLVGLKPMLLSPVG